MRPIYISLTLNAHNMKCRSIKLIVGVLTVLMAFGARSQQNDVMEKMVEIKLSDDFIYGEGSADNEALAYDLALTELVDYVNRWRQENGFDALRKSDLQNRGHELKGTSGATVVYLLYVTTEEARQIARASNADVAADLQASKNAAGTQTKPQADVQPAVKVATPASAASVPTKTYTPTLDEIADVLRAQDNWTEVKGFLSRYKAQGLIKETGRAVSMNAVPADAHCLLIDSMYGILSFLSPVQGDVRINMKTLQPDSETNYPNCQVIVWYKQ